MALGYDIMGIPRAPDTSIYGKWLMQQGLSAGDMAQIRRSNRLDAERADDKKLLRADQLKDDAIKSQELALRNKEFGLRSDELSARKAAQEANLADIKSQRQEAKNQDYQNMQGLGAIASYIQQDDPDGTILKPWLGKVPFKDLSEEQKNITYGYAKRGNIDDLSKVPRMYDAVRMQSGYLTPKEKEQSDLAQLPPPINEDTAASIGKLKAAGKSPEEIQLVTGGTIGQINAIPSRQSAPAQQPNNAPKPVPAAGASDSLKIQGNTPVSNKYNEGVDVFSNMFGGAQERSAVSESPNIVPVSPQEALSYQKVISSKGYKTKQEIAAGEGLSMDQVDSIIQGIGIAKGRIKPKPRLGATGEWDAPSQGGLPRMHIAPTG